MDAMSCFTPVAAPAENFLLPLLLEAYKRVSEEMDDWGMSYSEDDRHVWLSFRRSSATLPDQGWKIHLSADLLSAESVLRLTLPLLFARTARFKVVSSPQHLTLLNQGSYGESQVGKFITIYPLNDGEAVQLAQKLDTLTRGLCGPNVPSDRPLRPGSLVHYRYGSFRNDIYLQELNGAVLPAITTPDGTLVPDNRLQSFSAPAWASDPFLQTGVASDLPQAGRLLAGRYLIVAVLAASSNHILYMAADLLAGRTCIVKGVGSAWQYNDLAGEVRTEILHEAHILSLLGPDAHLPAFYDLVEQDGRPFLVMQELRGETLASRIKTIRDEGPCPIQQAVAWAIELAELLESIHQKGIIYADLKSANVMLGSDGHVSLVDFEYAREQSDEQVRGRGTCGYMSPQQQEGLFATVQDDIYGFGALFYFMVTGTEPSLAPDPLAHLARPLTLLRPGIPPSVQSVIERCLAPAREQRYASMSEVKMALVAIEQEQQDEPGRYPGTSNEQPGEKGMEAHQRYRTLASQLCDTLCLTARRQRDQSGLFWTSNVPSLSGIILRDIYAGTGGVVLALAQLVATLDDIHDSARFTLSEGAQALCTTSRQHRQCLPGLFIGEAGVGTALLRAGQALRDSALIEAALERGRYVAALPHASPDMLLGSAGRLLFHCWLWEAAGENAELLAAQASAEYLLQAATWISDRSCCWHIPAGYANLSTKAFTGYAHGTAGIADALLSFFEASADERLVPAIQGAANWLADLALPALPDGTGLNWPGAAGDTQVAAANWRSGATGIARFFLHAGMSGIVPGALEVAEKAARTVISTSRWSGPTQSYGLLGTIELLLDFYQATGDHACLREAFAFAQLLEAFAAQQDGLVVFPTDSPTYYTPDYMIGYSGVATCLLRLSQPERIPYLFSRASFHPREDSVHAHDEHLQTSSVFPCHSERSEESLPLRRPPGEVSSSLRSE